MFTLQSNPLELLRRELQTCKTIPRCALASRGEKTHSSN